MPVEIHGKQYFTVAERIDMFRSDNPYATLETEILSNADEILIKATVKDEEGRVLATGHASETRGAGNINKFAALENCETGAIGRCLSALGYLGTEVDYASAEERLMALAKEEADKGLDRVRKHIKAIRENWPSVEAILNGIAADDLSIASEAWQELDTDTKLALWLAPTKGGIFTTQEREVMKSTEFRTANGTQE